MAKIPQNYCHFCIFSTSELSILTLKFSKLKHLRVSPELGTGCFFWDESRFLSGTVKYAKCMSNHKKDLLGNKYAVRHSFRKIQNWKVYFGGSILHVKNLLRCRGKFLTRIIFWVTTTFLWPAATIWRPVAIPLHHKKCVATLLNIKNLFMMLL